MPVEASICEEMTCSVVVCTRNRPIELEKCLAGISQQIFKPIEVIVVDNAPNKLSAEEAACRWGAKYICEPRLGLSRARNRGAREAQGTIVAYIDDDALPQPDWLGKLLVAFHDSTVVAAAGRTLPPQATPEVMELCRRIQGPGLEQHAFVLDNTHPHWFEMAAFGGIASGSNMSFRREVFGHWPGFDPRLGLPDAGCEEHYAFLSLIDLGFRAAYMPDAVVVHPTGYTLEQLRARYIASCAYAISYMLFLLMHAPRHRRKLLKFLYARISGAGRTRRPKADAVRFDCGVSGLRIFLARCRGGWLYLRFRHSESS